MKFAVQIQSYNRYDKLTSLLNQIREQDAECPIIVVNDCSFDKRYNTLEKEYNALTVIKTPSNGGKEKYWRTVNMGLKRTMKKQWDWLIFLADDFTISPDFFNTLRGVCKNTKTVINFFPTNQSSMWDYRWFIDGAFCSSRQMWQDIKWNVGRIHHNRWERNPNLSSGVWHNVTKKLNNAGYKVEFTVPICEHNGNEDSKMHPEIRKKNPICLKK